MKQILQYLFNHQTLTKAEAKAIMIEIAQNKFNETEVSVYHCFMMRSITGRNARFPRSFARFSGESRFRNARFGRHCRNWRRWKNTFNISTLASFIVAGTGQKWRNTAIGVSAISGSSNVLEELGYQFKDNQEDLKKDLEKANICFLHAPLFSPSIKNGGL